LPSTALVRAAQKVLLQNIAQPPTAHDLAQQFGSNEKKLNEAFRDHCGLTAYGWLRDERLRRAAELLAVIELPIAEIAENLGYSTAQNFATAFREKYDVSPSQYRESLSQSVRTRDAIE
jgi:AraC-like DNA-binding protein